MKKLLAMLLVLTMVLSLVACTSSSQKPTEEPAQEPAEATTEAVAEPAAEEGHPPDRNFGMLSMLNMTEEECRALVSARGLIGETLGAGEPHEGQPPEGQSPEGQPPKSTVIFYDTLDAMLMALNAGEINNIEIYESVARYLSATNDNLIITESSDGDKSSETFVQAIQNGIGGNDFAFLMMENNTALRDEFNAAIADMKDDGTLDRLVKEQIDDLIDGGEIKAVEMPRFDGAETVKVAVTGALPPMDYVAADGTPAGFNTAVLAEIGSRIGKNIELVVVDSLGRAVALTSGTVDAVFWTRTSSLAQEAASLTETEREARRAEKDANMTEEEIKVLQEVNDNIDFASYGTADMAEGTIITEPYFSDVIVPVMLAGSGEQGK